MKAGRELDALIAEKVMGLIAYKVQLVAPPPRVRTIDELQRVGSPLPHYSTNIADAWEVVDLGHPCGWFDSYYIMRYGAGYAIGRCMDDAVYAEADTAPLAICLAALKAKGVTHE